MSVSDQANPPQMDPEVRPDVIDPAVKPPVAEEEFGGNKRLLRSWEALALSIL
jgi:hypothetical protein